MRSRWWGRRLPALVVCALAAACGGGDGQPESEHCRPAAAVQEPQWTTGRYFPTFPASDYAYVIQAETQLDDHQASWDASWRISDSPETMHALTLVGMQGVINRETPCVYLDWNDSVTGASDFWAAELAKHVTTEQVDARGAAAVDFLYQRFSDRFSGAVLYDPAVPDTINLATMIAGIENRVILAPQQIGEDGIPEFADVMDLGALAADQGWDASDRGKLAIYQWAHDNLWDRLDTRVFGVVSPGPPTSGAIGGEDGAYPLGIAARDYLVALRSPAVWLAPTSDGERALLDTMLTEAPSPIPVTGAYDEFTMVSLVSQHGDWMAALTWPNAPLTAGNLTVLAGVQEEPPPYRAELDGERILATLGTHPVTTIFFSDGDNLGYQMDRGFWSADPAYSQSWQDMQGHRVGWTSNAALADLAPIAWRYYIDSADAVTPVAGLGGAGYAYPQLMSGDQLDAYLELTAAYLERSGLRVVHLYTGGLGGDVSVDYPSIAAAYQAQLGASGYLGAYTGVGSPVWGLNIDYSGGPASGVTPMAYSSRQQILDNLPDRRLGDFTVVLAQWPQLLNNVGQVVDDASRPGGVVMQYASSIDACCLVFVTSPQHLLAGTYTATFTLKVADTGSSEEVAAITAADASGDLAQVRLHPSDFTQVGQWQSFTLEFTLDPDDPAVNFLLQFFPGVTDLTASTLRVERTGSDPLPLFAPIFSFPYSGPKRELAALADDLEEAGVVVLTPDEFMAALNPAFMIELAAARLGAGDPSIADAREQLDAGEYLQALLTVRAALAASL